MLLKKIPAFIISFLLCMVAHADNHAIKVSVAGLKNVNVLLAHYHANEKTKYAVDTALLDNNGTGVFNNSRDLGHGVYVIVLPDYRTIDFILGDAKTFEINATLLPSPQILKFINSEENTEYLVYKAKTNRYDSAYKKISSMLRQKNTGTSEMQLKQALTKAGTEYENYRTSVVKKYPKTFLEELVSSRLMEPHRVMAPSDVWIFKSVNLLNTPRFEKALFYFVDSLEIWRTRDSLAFILTQIFNNGMVSNELFRYLSSALLKHYRGVAGSEDVFLYVAENYYIPFVTWDSPEDMNQLQSEIDILKPTMPGSFAPNIYLNKYYIPSNTATIQDTSFFKSTLFSAKGDNLVVVFWDEDCDSCRQNILNLYRIIGRLPNKNTTLVSMTNANSPEHLASWLDFVNKNKMYECVNAAPFSMYFKTVYMVNGTMAIYILDKDRKIKARKVPWYEVVGYLWN
jgi:hypothetical protein